MKKLSLLSLMCLCWLPTFGQQPILQDGFEYADREQGLVNRWDISGTVRLDTNDFRSGKTSVVIAGTNAFLATRQTIFAPGSVQFWVKPAQYEDNFIMVLETSTDRVSWTEVSNSEINQTFDQGQTQAATNYRLISRTLNSVEKVYLRWRIKSYASGSLKIDDITVLPISEEARQQVEAKRLQEEVNRQIQNELSKFGSTQKLQDAVATLDLTKKTYVSRTNTLAKLVLQTTNIKIITGTSSALGTRNQMANPMSYSTFNETVETLRGVLDSTNRMFLDDIVSNIKNPLEKFKEKIAPIGNIVGAVGNILTAGRLDVFVNSFKSLLAQGYSQDNLASRFPMIGKKANPKFAEMLTKGPEIYKSTRKFLEVISDENDRANELNGSINNLYKEATLLNNEIINFGMEYYQLIGLEVSSDFIYKLGRGDREAMSESSQKIEAFFNKLIEERKANSASADNQRRTLEKVERILVKIDDFVQKYEGLSTNMAGFYHGFVQDLERTNPFKNVSEDATNTWESQRSRALEILKSTEQDFKKQFLNFNFY